MMHTHSLASVGSGPKHTGYRHTLGKAGLLLMTDVLCMFRKALVVGLAPLWAARAGAIRVCLHGEKIIVLTVSTRVLMPVMRAFICLRRSR